MLLIVPPFSNILVAVDHVHCRVRSILCNLVITAHVEDALSKIDCLGAGFHARVQAYIACNGVK